MRSGTRPGTVWGFERFRFLTLYGSIALGEETDIDLCVFFDRKGKRHRDSGISQIPSKTVTNLQHLPFYNKGGVFVRARIFLP